MFRQVSTRERGEKGGGGGEACFNRSERVSTGSNVFRHVQTGLDRSERIETCFDRFQRGGGETCFNRSERVSTGLNGLQGEKYAVCFFDNNNTVEKHLFFLIQSIYFS